MVFLVHEDDFIMYPKCWYLFLLIALLKNKEGGHGVMGVVLCFFF